LAIDKELPKVYRLQYKKGEQIFKQNGFGIHLPGWKRDHRGRQQRRLALRPPGRVRQSEEENAEGPVRVGILDKESLAKQYNEMSPMLRALTRSLATKLRETTSKICSTLVAQE
jgi:hypothetical protein